MSHLLCSIISSEPASNQYVNMVILEKNEGCNLSLNFTDSTSLFVSAKSDVHPSSAGFMVWRAGVCVSGGGIRGQMRDTCIPYVIRYAIHCMSNQCTVIKLCIQFFRVNVQC